MSKVVKKIEVKPVSTDTAPFERAILVKDGKSAKRLLSRLISQFQKNEITDSKAKTLCYMLSVFIGVCQQSELEQRLNEIEKKILSM